jgi:hypothetical protein
MDDDGFLDLGTLGMEGGGATVLEVAVEPVRRPPAGDADAVPPLGLRFDDDGFVDCDASSDVLPGAASYRGLSLKDVGGGALSAIMAALAAADKRIEEEEAAAAAAAAALGAGAAWPSVGAGEGREDALRFFGAAGLDVGSDSEPADLLALLDEATSEEVDGVPAGAGAAFAALAVAAGEGTGEVAAGAFVELSTLDMVAAAVPPRSPSPTMASRAAAYAQDRSVGGSGGSNAGSSSDASIGGGAPVSQADSTPPQQPQDAGAKIQIDVSQLGLSLRGLASQHAMAPAAGSGLEAAADAGAGTAGNLPPAGSPSAPSAAVTPPPSTGTPIPSLGSEAGPGSSASHAGAAAAGGAGDGQDPTRHLPLGALVCAPEGELDPTVHVAPLQHVDPAKGGCCECLLGGWGAHPCLTAVSGAGAFCSLQLPSAGKASHVCPAPLPALAAPAACPCCLPLLPLLLSAAAPAAGAWPTMHSPHALPRRTLVARPGPVPQVPSPACCPPWSLCRSPPRCPECCWQACTKLWPRLRRVPRPTATPQRCPRRTRPPRR